MIHILVHDWINIVDPYSSSVFFWYDDCPPFFEDSCTLSSQMINGEELTWKESCVALSLLQDDKEWALSEVLPVHQREG